MSGYACVACGRAGSGVIDVSEPPHPFEVGFYNESAGAVAVGSRYATMLDRYTGLYIIGNVWLNGIGENGKRFPVAYSSYQNYPTLQSNNHYSVRFGGGMAGNDYDLFYFGSKS